MKDFKIFTLLFQIYSQEKKVIKKYYIHITLFDIKRK